MWKAITLSLVLALSSAAPTWAQDSGNEFVITVPTDLDTRLFFVAETLSPHRVQVGSPYNYGSMYEGERQRLVQFARWGCQLYGRDRLAYVGIQTNDQRCDEMGAAAAERDPHCYHIHTFVCVER